MPRIVPVIDISQLAKKKKKKRKKREKGCVEAHGPESDPENLLFRNVGENVLKSRLRSHWDVAQRYYADLLELELRTAAE